MAQKLNIAVDCMSGDHGPRSNIQGILSFMNMVDNVSLHLCGDASILTPLIPQELQPNILIHHCELSLQKDIKPSSALRLKETTSLHLAFDLLSTDIADMIVSSANTGAYMALALKKIGLKDGVKRPAIAKILPSLVSNSPSSETLILDLGANIECSVDILKNFMHVGYDYLQSSKRLTKPTAGILNIGSEAGKGTQALQDLFAYAQEDGRIDFKGFIEADQLLTGCVDMIICDGFHGNIALKTMEGTIQAFYSILKHTLNKPGIRSTIGKLAWGPQLKQTFGETYNPKKYNGALLMGLKKPVVKSHGGADSDSFCHALKTAYTLSQVNS